VKSEDTVSLPAIIGPDAKRAMCLLVMNLQISGRDLFLVAYFQLTSLSGDEVIKLKRFTISGGG
jgi:hypothetical protein